MQISSCTRTGIGIDAGGTYTDVAVYDFDADGVLASSKALTTRWDYTEGIMAALDGLPEEHLQQASVVSVSTTLATNALVENEGQTVGLILMPPYGQWDERQLRHKPLAVVRGYMEMTGEILEPIDPDQIEAAARAMAADHGVAAFAVSGVGATVNASQEMQAAEVVRRSTGLSVTCGHQVSAKLGIFERATTAIFNAQVIPFIEAFLDQLEGLLRRRGVEAPMMVVKGDGTLMSVGLAKERPVETIFSGPAASVAGARKLTGLQDALVVDIGGTTTDIAAVRNNRVQTCPRGSVVAGRRTHVEALDMRTKGLGGDSAVVLTNKEPRIGPGRVTPICCLASRSPGLAEALDYLEADLDPYAFDTLPMRLLSTSGRRPGFDLKPTEEAILDLLQERPHSLAELTEKLDLAYQGLSMCSRLLEARSVAVSALTPTDILHAGERIRLWEAEAARRACRLHARIMGMDDGAFASLVLDAFTRELAVEVFHKLSEIDAKGDGAKTSPICRAVLRNWLTPAEGALSIAMHYPFPIIGVGAPAAELLPDAVRLFNTELVTPQRYEVANAVGAATTFVSVSKTACVAPRNGELFAIEGLADGREFEELDAAIACAREQLEQDVRELAAKAGLHNAEVEVSTENVTAMNGYGCDVHLRTELTATAKAPAYAVREASPTDPA